MSLLVDGLGLLVAGGLWLTAGATVAGLVGLVVHRDPTEPGS